MIRKSVSTTDVITKHNTESEKALLRLLTILESDEKRLAASDRSLASVGCDFCWMWLPLSACRGSKAGDVGTPLLSWIGLGNELFHLSRSTALLLLNQALAYLDEKPLRSSIDKHGIVLASIFRVKELKHVCWWHFVRQYELCKKPTKKEKKALTDGDSNAAEPSAAGRDESRGDGRIGKHVHRGRH
jgi:hypothetical protein